MNCIEIKCVIVQLKKKSACVLRGSLQTYSESYQAFSTCGHIPPTVKLTSLVHSMEQTPVMVKLSAPGGMTMDGVTPLPRKMMPASCSGCSVV